MKKSTALKSKKTVKPEKVYTLHNSVNQLCDLARDKKGEDIVALDISEVSSIADIFIIITANTKTHLIALVKYLEEELRNLSYQKIGIEGRVNSSWSVLDFGEIVIHVMQKEQRDFYKLESYWNNAKIISQ